MYLARRVPGIASSLDHDIRQPGPGLRLLRPTLDAALPPRRSHARAIRSCRYTPSDLPVCGARTPVIDPRSSAWLGISPADLRKFTKQGKRSAMKRHQLRHLDGELLGK